MLHRLPNGLREPPIERRFTKPDHVPDAVEQGTDKDAKKPVEPDLKPEELVPDRRLPPKHLPRPTRR